MLDADLSGSGGMSGSVAFAFLVDSSLNDGLLLCRAFIVILNTITLFQSLGAQKALQVDAH